MSKRRFLRNGRNGGHAPFIMLPRWITQSPAFRALSGDGLKVLLAIWERHSGANNGTIAFATRDGEAINLSKDRTKRALDELTGLGFLVCERAATFDTKVKAGQARLWRLTAEPCGTVAATKDFMRWSPPAGAPAKANGVAHREPVPATVEAVSMRSRPGETLQ